MTARPTAPLSPSTPAGQSLGAMPCSLSSLLDLRHADCMAVMRDTADNAYDLAIVDPPYGIGVSGEGKMTSNSRKEYARKNWDDAVPPPEYFAELRRVSKHQIIWGGNYFPLPPSRCWLLWDKLDPNSDFAAAEMAWTSFDRVVKKFEMSRKAAALVGGIHPTQKPVALYNWTLANYAKPGMRVLDTHMGSGSIAIAAHYAGIHLTACEIDADYYEAATARIKRETAQVELFSPHNVIISHGEDGPRTKL